MRASLFLYWIQKRRAVAADFAINNVTNFETSVTNLDRIGGVPCISTTPQYKYIMPDPIRARNRARERSDPCMETEHGIGEGIETEHKMNGCVAIGNVCPLRTLEAVAVLGLLAHDVEDGVDELGALGVVALGPVVAGARLAVDEVVGAEDAAEGAGADGLHGAGLEVHEHGAGHVAAAPGLVVVDVDPLELLRGGPRVAARGVDGVLPADHLPELGADLVPALPALDVQDLPHG